MRTTNDTPDRELCKQLIVLLASVCLTLANTAYGQSAPVPLLAREQPVDWWFVFKLNSKAFPGCGGNEGRACPFGGDVQQYVFGQQFVYASSTSPELQKGSGCVGATGTDPVGATFSEIYNGSFYYVIWNDQFYDDPEIPGCTKQCGSPWGHSKGIVAWNEHGEGLVMQVTTPSWPAAGNKDFARKSDGNTLGCVKDDDVKVSQHFFALKLGKDDLLKVLTALKNASVVTDPTNKQIVNNGGPTDVQELVASLGKRQHGKSATRQTLSSGVELISKPSALHVPPWQMVSALLGGVSLRAATWWTRPKIYSTTAASEMRCWDQNLESPGAVEIATTGQWQGKTFGLQGGPGPDFNHAKIGVSTSSNKHYAIFGDLNQQGTVAGPNCASSQNGRGGTFYVLENEQLSGAIAELIRGEKAPTEAP